MACPTIVALKWVLQNWEGGVKLTIGARLYENRDGSTQALRCEFGAGERERRRGACWKTTKVDGMGRKKRKGKGE